MVSNQWMSIDLVIGVCFYINVIDLQSPIALRNLGKNGDFSSNLILRSLCPTTSFDILFLYIFNNTIVYEKNSFRWGLNSNTKLIGDCGNIFQTELQSCSFCFLNTFEFIMDSLAIHIIWKCVFLFHIIISPQVQQSFL